MQRDELAAWLRLSLTPGVGNGAARRLLAAFGLPQRIFEHSDSTLQTCVSAAQARALRTPPAEFDARLEQAWQWLQQGATPYDNAPAHALITLGDAAYPPALLATQDPPLLLYAVGAPRFVRARPLVPEQCLAMVGSRNPTAQGLENARQFARSLRAAGWTIVSGLALGVDAAAHEGALLELMDTALPATIAVVGTGVDRVYPRANSALAQRIAQNGLILSEYPLGTPPLAANFPKRNRIIAGLARGALVVEAALASGSLVTARFAAEQGREVFAIPGSIHAPQSRGCHALLRQGAKLVETAQDVLEELRWPARAQLPLGMTPVPTVAPPPIHAEDDVLTALGFDPLGLDALVARTGLDVAMLQVRLLELELDGRVARLPGGIFQRVGTA